MKRRASFFIAIRYLWGRAKEGGRYLRGAATGIAVSLVPIIVTLIVADGMIRGIMDRYLELGTGHLQVFDIFNMDSYDEIIDDLKEIRGIKGVWQERRGTGVIAGRNSETGNTSRAGVTIRATDPSFWTYEGNKNLLKIREGESDPKTDRDIVLGETLADNLGVKIGDTVRLMSVALTDSNMFLPRTAVFIVSGIISCGYNELDALWCIVSLEGGMRILSREQSNSSLLLKIDDPYRNIDRITWDLYMTLGGGYSIYSWKELLRSQYSSYEMTRQLLLFIMALIVIVAAVNVASSTSMLVLERQKDIAILKISGGSIKGITNIFIAGSFLTGLFGSIIGITTGLLIGVNINSIIRGLERFLSFFSHLFKGGNVTILDPGFYLETIPIIIDGGAVFLIGVFAILCSILASLIPATRAGKLKPMELLRKN